MSRGGRTRTATRILSFWLEPFKFRMCSVESSVRKVSYLICLSLKSIDYGGVENNMDKKILIDLNSI